VPQVFIVSRDYIQQLMLMPLLMWFVAVNSLIPSADLVLDPSLKPPGDVQAKLLRQIVLSGLGDHVARFVAAFLPFS